MTVAMLMTLFPWLSWVVAAAMIWRIRIEGWGTF